MPLPRNVPPHPKQVTHEDTEPGGGMVGRVQPVSLGAVRDLEDLADVVALVSA